MALANKRTQNKETHSSSFYSEKVREEDPLYRSISSPLDLFSFKDMHPPSLLDEEEESGSNNSLRAYYGGFAPTQYDSSNSSYSNFVSGANSSSAIQEANSCWMGSKNSVLDNWAYSSSSVLSFDRDEECANWVGAVDQNITINANSTSITDSHDHEGVEKKVSQKRTHMGGEAQASKKQCVANKKAKAKPTCTESKDPQSAAAKVRRERISERLKVLQELVPNGTKVDMVTMLEKAISYVKFLQLQVKVLAADEFWPTQGGKAPNLSQVKGAIDAILFSQRNNCSKDN